MESGEGILAPNELLRAALNICRAMEIAERENDDRVADDCLNMLVQHLHMAKVVLVHSDLLLAGNVERAAREILQEARETGHISQYLSPTGQASTGLGPRTGTTTERRTGARAQRRRGVSARPGNGRTPVAPLLVPSRSPHPL